MISQCPDDDIFERSIIFPRSGKDVLGSNRELIALPVHDTSAPELLDGELYQPWYPVLDSSQVDLGV